MGLTHRLIIPVWNDGDFVCPGCGSPAEVSSWADNGESDLADWWDCRCGATGAYLHPRLPGVTQNGVPLIGYSPLHN